MKDDEVFSNISDLWSESDKERFGKERKSSSQYGIYEKHSSYFGINVKNLEMININYADTRKMMDMLASKYPLSKEENHINYGSTQINPWIMNNLIREEFQLRSIIVYFESKMHLDPTTYLFIFNVFKKLIKITMKIANKNEKEITENDLINETVIERISSELGSENEELYINQYLMKIAPFKNLKVRYFEASKAEDFNHPLVQFCARELRLKGTKDESVYANLIQQVRGLFRWLTQNIESYKHKNINNIIVNEIKAEHVNDYRSFLLRMVNEGEMSERSAKKWIDCIYTFFSILYQKKRISKDIASDITKIKIDDYKYRPIPKESEVREFLDVIFLYSDEPEKELLAFLLMLFMGFRGIEVANLKWDDINLGTKTVVINESKRNSSILPIPDLIYNHLLKINNKESGYVFEKNPKSFKRKLYRNYKIYTLIAGWDYDGGLHLLRHTFITNVTKYSSLPLIKELARHKSGHMPSRYIHLERQYVKDELAKLDLIEGDLK
ncbi:site-specific integrase [Peribacillus saganii]|uniref:Site-specific integrase n=1 Tax=Peribacillus saganii TaxID=2303992 RepID=A0A372LM50_9BACI|nr:site-specific integrase [Peribacillus saganii]RFU67474.1 site-specific integrase [Peribacillus saganii]